MKNEKIAEVLNSFLAGQESKGQPLTVEEIAFVDAVLMRLSYRLRHSIPEIEKDTYSPSFFVSRDIGTIREVLHYQSVKITGEISHLSDTL